MRESKQETHSAALRKLRNNKRLLIFGEFLCIVAMAITIAPGFPDRLRLFVIALFLVVCFLALLGTHLIDANILLTEIKALLEKREDK